MCSRNLPPHVHPQLSSQPDQQSDCNSFTDLEDELATKPESNETSSSTTSLTDANQEQPVIKVTSSPTNHFFRQGVSSLLLYLPSNLAPTIH